MGLLILIITLGILALWGAIAKRKEWSENTQVGGFWLIGAISLVMWIASCSEEAPKPPIVASKPDQSAPAQVPKEAAAWCQYNDFRNNAYREEGKKWDAAHPHEPSMPMAYQKKMVKRIEQKIKVEQKRLFGAMSDDDFQRMDMGTISKNWYQKYCKAPEQEWAPVTNSAWDGSVRQVESWIKKNLNDADSFKAEEWSPVVKTDDGYIVRCKFRAKNAYGAYMLSNAVFRLDRQGNVVDASGLN